MFGHICQIWERENRICSVPGPDISDSPKILRLPYISGLLHWTPETKTRYVWLLAWTCPVTPNFLKPNIFVSIHQILVSKIRYVWPFDWTCPLIFFSTTKSIGTVHIHPYPLDSSEQNQICPTPRPDMSSRYFFQWLSPSAPDISGAWTGFQRGLSDLSSVYQGGSPPPFTQLVTPLIWKFFLHEIL
jgi:hypothetical protein